MLLMDNVRTFILVGLICAAGITPAYSADAINCFTESTEALCTDATHVCKVVVADAKASGCVDAATDCAGLTVGATLTCDANSCCCNGDKCNEIEAAHANCKITELMGQGVCAAAATDAPGGGAAPSGSTEASAGGAGGASTAAASGEDGEGSGVFLTSSIGVVITMMTLGAYVSRDVSCPRA